MSISFLDAEGETVAKFDPAEDKDGPPEAKQA